MLLVTEKVDLFGMVGKIFNKVAQAKCRVRNGGRKSGDRFGGSGTTTLQLATVNLGFPRFFFFCASGSRSKSCPVVREF